MFSAVLILILLTEMVIYATSVGVFEQRKSGNELRQKQAFHAAEVGIQGAQEYLLAYVFDLTSQKPADGWLSTTHMSAGGSGRWLPCAGRNEGDDPHPQWHPCYGEPLDGEGVTPEGDEEPNLRDLSYFYSEDGVHATPIPMPLDVGGELLGTNTEAVEVYALLCMLDIQHNLERPVRGCLDESQRALFDEVYFTITLLARGHSDCELDGGGEPTNCLGEALISQRIGSYGPVPDSGGPGVPLTSKSNVAPGGTIEIVPNPNGAGIGVPVSVWVDGDADGNPICNDNPDGPAIDPSSESWATCEMQEWYGVDIMPADYTCPGNCKCDADELVLSKGLHAGPNFDIIVDPGFPCELFKYTFGTDDYKEVKPLFKVIKDCAELGPTSEGLIWIDGSVGNCDINAVDIGAPPGEPVFIVSAANLLSIGGGTNIYGVVMTTDIEGTAGEFKGSGDSVVYGAVIIDGHLRDQYGSNFTIVYNDELIGLATKRGSLGNLYGGWTDFHEDWR